MQALPVERPVGDAPQVDVESVEFLRQMAGLVPGIIYIFNRQTMSNTYSNRSIAELLGYLPEEVQQMGDSFLPTIMHPEDLARVGAHFAALQEREIGAPLTFEYRVTAKDGRLVWLRSLEAVFDRNPNGAVLNHIGIAFDITAQKLAEEELQRTNAELEERVRRRTEELNALNRELEDRVRLGTAELLKTNRDLEQLTFVATHDLKVPINNMTSLTHMLSEAGDLLPPEHAETLGWMREVCQQASEKLEALICVAQAHSGAMDPFQMVSLAEVTERVLLNLHFQSADVKAVIRTDFAEPSVFFLPVEMETILQALIGNALKYRQPGRRPKIDISSRADAHCVLISVRDNGSGLDLPRDKPKVFGLFQRAHNTPEGAGVALYAVRQVLERSGGSINVESTLGEGSTFTVKLPRRMTEMSG